MPSFDYIYDLIEKFKRDGFSFVVTFLQQGKESDQVHVFYEYKTEDEAREIIEAMRMAINNIKEEIGDDRIDEDGGGEGGIF